MKTVLAGMMFGVFLGGWAYARSAPSLVLRFDDNKSVSQWREVAGIFEAVGGRCSFAVNSATLSEEQWDGLRELSAHRPGQRFLGSGLMGFLHHARGSVLGGGRRLSTGGG